MRIAIALSVASTCQICHGRPAGFNIESGIYNRLSLADGRALAYREFGPTSGKPVVYFHGSPAASLDVKLLLSQVDTSQYRIIAADRPGVGYSDPNKCNTVSRYVADTFELTEYLGIQQYHAIGYSAGCRFALGCASLRPSQVLSLALISPRAPAAPGVGEGVLDRDIEQVKRFPRLASLLLARVANLQRNQSRMTAGLQRSMSKFAAVDQRVARSFESTLVEIFNSAARQGVQGIIDEIQHVPWPWGIDLSRIVCPVHLWIGSCDTTAPLSTVSFLERNLRSTQTQIVESEGHLSLIVNHGARILEAV